MSTPECSSDLIGALAGRGTPGGNVAVAAAPLLLQFRTVAVLVCVGAGVGCRGGGAMLTSVNRHINEESKCSAHFLFRVIVNTYYTACCCRHCRSLRKWFLTCMGGCTGCSRCNVVQHVIQWIKDNKKLWAKIYHTVGGKKNFLNTLLILLFFYF